MGDVSTEPTMEEILSSIKRVIEESETNVPAAQRKPRPARTTVPLPAASPREDVLELSDPAPFGEARPPAREVDDTPVKPDSIVSDGAAEASRGALEALSRLVVKPESAGADTLEGLVREMLRPMLRDWLDAHLPEIVETMVSREIARIAGRGF